MSHPRIRIGTQVSRQPRDWGEEPRDGKNKFPGDQTDQLGYDAGSIYVKGIELAAWIMAAPPRDMKAPQMRSAKVQKWEEDRLVYGQAGSVFRFPRPRLGRWHERPIKGFPLWCLTPLVPEPQVGGSPVQISNPSSLLYRYISFPQKKLDGCPSPRHINILPPASFLYSSLSLSRQQLSLSTQFTSNITTTSRPTIQPVLLQAPTMSATTAATTHLLHLSHKPFTMNSGLPTPTESPLPTPPPIDLVVKRQSPALSLAYQHLTTLRKFLVVTDGRDKALKLVQYIVKVLLWSYLDARKKHHSDLHGHLHALASHFSTTRKIIRLGHVIEPYGELVDFNSLPPLPTTAPRRERIFRALAVVYCVLALAQDVSDDVYCLAKIGVIPRHLAKQAEPWSIKLWFVTIWLDVHKNLWDTWLVHKKMQRLRHVIYEREKRRRAKEGEQKDGEVSYDVIEFDFELEKREKEDEERMREKVFWLQLSLVKLLMDGAFCGYDYFQCNFSDGFQAVTGLVSGLLSSYKLWYKCSHS
ncbi:peroxisomal biogenesis factor 11-domain-containing protein [Endogone sp. FLAS-F59071]|nr:peroxisomal biogenesis factor 11-domain-containing protein [Endogone sp. FLAS-F59071]|eukprot:RUS15798.1 peroxisomal biogenesis factor 11-domain-containing protein [Endogone sp. FLAS-F59071]